MWQFSHRRFYNVSIFYIIRLQDIRNLELLLKEFQEGRLSSFFAALIAGGASIRLILLFTSRLSAWDNVVLRFSIFAKASAYSKSYDTEIPNLSESRRFVCEKYARCEIALFSLASPQTVLKKIKLN